MWTELLNRQQIQIGSRIRKEILEGMGSYWTEYVVIDLGQFYFLMQAKSTDKILKIPIDQQEIYPTLYSKLPSIGLTIFIA